MRDLAPHVLDEQTASELLTTGEAARLMNSSRSHVVDLCDIGVLPCVRSGNKGTHRRIRRGDIEARIAAHAAVREVEDETDAEFLLGVFHLAIEVNKYLHTEGPGCEGYVPFKYTPFDQRYGSAPGSTQE
jgi:excisionase family DNA binding protein